MPEVPFNAFKEGFDCVLSGSVVDIFRPEELAELVSGSPTLDFHDLEANTQYDGFDKESSMIKYVFFDRDLRLQVFLGNCARNGRRFKKETLVLRDWI